MPHSSTLSQALTDRLSAQESIREARFIALQDTARLQIEQVQHVLRTRTFAPAHDLFRFTPGGVLTQAAMTVTGAGEKVTVVAKIEDGEAAPIWFITDMTRLTFPASVYIKAVQARQEANRRAN